MQLTVRQVSKFLNVAESTITRWIKQRGLPAQHVGGQYRFHRAEVLEWATANQIRVSLEMFDEPEMPHEPPPVLARLWKRAESITDLKTPIRSARFALW